MSSIVSSVATRFDTAPHEQAVGAPINRMAIAILGLAGVFLSTYLLLVKMGYIGELACGAGSCDRVQASRYAVFLGVPVPAWGVGGYLSITALAIAGLQPQLLRGGWAGAGLVGLTGIAFVFSMYLTYLEAFVINAWCRWCVASAVMATLLFAFAVPEIGRIRRRGTDE